MSTPPRDFGRFWALPRSRRPSRPPVPPRAMKMNEISLDDVRALLDNAARRHHARVWLVGGCVRDTLLGKQGKDIDLVCEGDEGLAVLRDVAHQLGWSRPLVFERFGTAQIRSGEMVIEMVQARSERYDPTSRKPHVSPGTLADDIARRDFTVNALAMSLEGEIVDLSGRGRADLASGILRTPSAALITFEEDPLRMWRAARFVSQLGFTVTDEIVEAMGALVGRMDIISKERIGQEFSRLVVGAYPKEGMELLARTGHLAAVLPHLDALVGVEQGGYHLYDAFTHSLVAMEASPPTLVARLAALYHDVGKPATHQREGDHHTFLGHPEVGAPLLQEELARIRIPGDVIAAVATLVRLHMRPIQYSERFSDSAVRRLVRDAGSLRHELIDLARADTLASAYPTLDEVEELAVRMDALDATGVLARGIPPLGGEEIMQLAHGKEPGRWIGVVQRALVDASLEGAFEPGDHEGAVRWLLEHPTLLAAQDGTAS